MILFNIAIEPLLQTIILDHQFVGITPASPPTPTSHYAPPPPPPLKVLGYADDVFVFLNNVLDLDRLVSHLANYQHASNAQLNPHKTVSLSLSGKPQPDWNHKLVEKGFPDCHDSNNTEPIVYLGFPFFSSKQQLNHFMLQLLLSI